MSLDSFLKLFTDSGNEVHLSVYLEPYDFGKHQYEKTLFEKCLKRDIVSSDIFPRIKNKHIQHFFLNGGIGYDRIEICICLKEIAKDIKLD